MSKFKSLLRKLNPRTKWRGVRGIRYNEDGVSAVEFALIAPVLVIIYLGCIELSFLMRVDRRVTTTSASLGDLTARLASVDNKDMAEMFQAARLLMQPYDVNKAKMRISSIQATAAGVTTVVWSDGYNMSSYAPGTPVTVPSGIVTPGGSVILAEVVYEYESQFGSIVKNKQNISDSFYLRPRRVNSIPRTPTGGGPGFGPGT